ncbi:MAG: hypothetical protein DHS80DRAFT_26306 [Piptocephalis tieghemiana]|nr:MAG: hypothetical protein DHS80DRAFT_26306 [Piptocephalis tieghemiana]
MFPALTRLGGSFVGLPQHLLGVPAIMQRATFRTRRRLTVKLIKDVPHLGSKGQTVRVRPGHMRNHLYPDELAIYTLRGRKPIRDRMAETIAEAKALQKSG